MRVLVCGGRTYKNFELLCETLDKLCIAIAPIDVIIHGAAPGADTLASKWATQRGIEPIPFVAQWQDLRTPPVVLRYNYAGKAYNAAAGNIRNQRMLDEGKPDVVVAFPGDKGTKDMVAKALRHQRRVQPDLRVIRVDEQGKLEELTP